MKLRLADEAEVFSSFLLSVLVSSGLFPLAPGEIIFLTSTFLMEPLRVSFKVPVIEPTSVVVDSNFSKSFSHSIVEPFFIAGFTNSRISSSVVWL